MSVDVHFEEHTVIIVPQNQFFSNKKRAMLIHILSSKVTDKSLVLAKAHA